MEWLTQILSALLLMITASYILKIFRSSVKFKNLLNKFPGPEPLPLIGSITDYMVPREQMATVFDKRFKEYGPVVRVWNPVCMDPDLFITKPEYLEVILTSTKHIKKSTAYDGLKPWLGTGLLTSTGKKWQLHRKLITPAFHFNILEDFFQVFVEKSKSLINTMTKLPVGTTVDLMPIISKCTLDIICETAMGTCMNIQEDKEHEKYVSAVLELSEITMYREFRPWLYSDFVFYRTQYGKQYAKCLQILHGFTENVIQKRKLHTNKKPSAEENSEDTSTGVRRRLALLDLLLATCDSPHPLTDLEIREEVDTFMFEGHDTTAMAITWALYLLGTHPHIQERVVVELEEIFSTSQRSPSFEDLVAMKYLERVIKEALRLYPSVPFIARKIEEDLPLGDGYIIPAGTGVTLDIFHTHRDPTQFPDPYVFNPDNFLLERTRKRHPFAYIPFSAGPRNCIGQKFAMMEEKTVLSAILRNFKIEAVEENVVMLQELTLKPVNGLLVKLTPRKH
uniref:Cytochrome P450 n=1 Tax=Homalodisca liturata TaxID=320908 RepID=A0A1B6HPU9_9HEMI